jgi:ribonucleotide reductase beta subunit family protein with ferritin-like domain
MNSIDMEIKQNFFENHATEYQMASAGDDDDGDF